MYPEQSVGMYTCSIIIIIYNQGTFHIHLHYQVDTLEIFSQLAWWSFDSFLILI